MASMNHENIYNTYKIFYNMLKIIIRLQMFKSYNFEFITLFNSTLMRGPDPPRILPKKGYQIRLYKEN